MLTAGSSTSRTLAVFWDRCSSKQREHRSQRTPRECDVYLLSSTTGAAPVAIAGDGQPRPTDLRVVAGMRVAVAIVRLSPLGQDVQPRLSAVHRCEEFGGMARFQTVVRSDQDREPA